MSHFFLSQAQILHRMWRCHGSRLLMILPLAILEHHQDQVPICLMSPLLSLPVQDTLYQPNRLNPAIYLPTGTRIRTMDGQNQHTWIPNQNPQNPLSAPAYLRTHKRSEPVWQMTFSIQLSILRENPIRSLLPGIPADVAPH